MKTIKIQWLGRVEYERALNLQNSLVSESRKGSGFASGMTGGTL